MTSRLQRPAVLSMFLLASVLGVSSANAGSKHVKRVGTVFPATAAAKSAPIATSTAPAVGWPHTILTGMSVSCAREPGPNEVIVASNPTFGGVCASLGAGFYPQPASFLVGNDTVSSIKVGSGLRARGFKNTVYGGDWMAFPPNTRAAGLGGFDNAISSFRIEPASRSMTCDDLREGEIALFEGAAGSGDCVVLPGDTSYPNAETMGIEGDSISSMHNNSARRLMAYWHSNFNQPGAEVKPHTKLQSLSTGGFMTDGIDNDILSIQMFVK